MLLFITTLACFVLADATYYKPTVYQKIRQSPKLSRFSSLLESNRAAKLNLQYGEMTVFVPTNEALDWYSHSNVDLSNMVNYHMAWHAKPIKDLHTGFLSTVMEESPPLWVTKLDDDIFINNARIVPEHSNYQSEINDRPKKPQVLHVIDEILDPVVKRDSTIYNPTVFDFLSRPQFWGNYKIDLIYKKILEMRKEAIFKSEGNFTFFVPLDEGFTSYRLQIFDGNVLEGHVIPNKVLFSRPTPKDMPFETMANADHFYVVLQFSGGEGKLLVKSHTLIGDANHPTGEIAAEIVKANIPVKNGVVHLIKRPLVVFDRTLTHFPNLPIMDKISMDPMLDITYVLGNETGFNKLFNYERSKFTYFVPRDKAWRNLQSFLEVNNTFFENFVRKYGKAILSRHVVADNVSYTIEELRKMSNVPDTADVDLNTLGGTLKIGIGESEGQYTIYWRNKIMPVYRANYECTNGIIHVVDEVFVTEEDVGGNDSQEENPENAFRLLNMLIRLTL